MMTDSGKANPCSSVLLELPPFNWFPLNSFQMECGEVIRSFRLKYCDLLDEMFPVKGFSLDSKVAIMTFVFNVQLKFWFSPIVRWIGGKNWFCIFTDECNQAICQLVAKQNIYFTSSLNWRKAVILVSFLPICSVLAFCKPWDLLLRLWFKLYLLGQSMITYRYKPYFGSVHTRK